VLLALLAVFVLLQLLPGGPALAILGKNATPERIAVFNQQNDLDKPLPVQFVLYIWRLLHLNLGYSYQLNQSVASLLGDRIPKTLVLAALAMALTLVIAIPMGVVQAARKDKVTDNVLTGVALVLYATPVFFSGLLLIVVFSIQLRWFPAQAPQSNDVGAIFAQFRGMVLPVVTLALAYIAGFSRYLRSSTLDHMSEEYARTARAKGASESRVFFIHVLRNALMPIITFIGLDLPYFLGGAVVIEVLFNYPGMGLLFWSAAQSQDYPILLGVTVVVAVAVVLGSLLADILYTVVDPRTRSVR
jgi:peptide/nickel transport system permease protein